MNVRQPAYIISSITLLIAFIMLVVSSFWYLYPYKTTEFTKEPFPILNENKTVRRGTSVNFIAEFCKTTKVQPTITRIFKNSLLFYTPPTVGSAPPGCYKMNVQVYVPEELPAGTFQIETVYSYQVNPIRNIKVIHSTERFTVTE